MATDNKYDRQLRLWGARGQRALSEAHILLVNADGSGTETLKNLVLPGVGRFTVCDDKTVMAEDLGSNFFVCPDRVGSSRAVAVTDLLCELNPDVKGEAICRSIASVLRQSTEEVRAFLKPFTLVVAANLPEQLLVQLAEACAVSFASTTTTTTTTTTLPLVSVRAYGFLGTVRCQYMKHEVVESKPDATKPDLRIAQPFPELVTFCDAFDLDSMDSQHHSHVPFVVILYKALSQWRAAHNGCAPKDFAEKQFFKETTVRGLARDAGEELNFQEAISQSYLAYSAADEMPYEVEELLRATASLTGGLDASTSGFEAMVHALHLFRVGSAGRAFPLAGEVPDMTAHSDVYVQLQQCYAAKAAADLATFTGILHGLKLAYPAVAATVEALSADDLAVFCKNVRNLRSMSTRTIKEERTNPAGDEVQEALYDPYPGSASQTPVLWYLALRAADKFRVRVGSYPGEGEKDTASLAADTDALWSDLVAVAGTFLPGSAQDVLHDSLAPLLTTAHAREVVRAGAVELHNVASMMGGIASQEAVKLITHQARRIRSSAAGAAGAAGAALCTLCHVAEMLGTREQHGQWAHTASGLGGPVPSKYSATRIDN